MTRRKVLGSSTHAWWMWMLAAGIAGCGNASTGTPPSGSAGNGTAANGNAGAAAATGDSPATGTTAGSGGTVASGGTPVTGTAGSGATGTGTTAGSGSPATSGAGNGTADAAAALSADPSGVTIWSGPEANDLIAPAASDGFQIASPDYNANDPNAKQLVVPPNQEIFLCYYYTIPGNADIDIGAIRSWMTNASSHHFILYQLSRATMSSGTIDTCATSSGNVGLWYGPIAPRRIVGMWTCHSAVGFTDGRRNAAGREHAIFINPPQRGSGTVTTYPKN